MPFFDVLQLSDAFVSTAPMLPSESRLRYDGMRSRRGSLLCLHQLHTWLRGDLSQRAKSLMLLVPIPASKTKPNNPLRLLGFV
jgi:hypothetical protein